MEFFELLKAVTLKIAQKTAPQMAAWTSVRIGLFVVVVLWVLYFIRRAKARAFIAEFNTLTHTDMDEMLHYHSIPDEFVAFDDAARFAYFVRSYRFAAWIVTALAILIFGSIMLKTATRDVFFDRVSWEPIEKPADIPGVSATPNGRNGR